MIAPVLRLVEVSKRFGDTLALDGVNFELRPREAVGLVGENGAGKSTLLEVIAGLTVPDAGRIILRGEPVRLRSAVEAARAGIAMVSQEQRLVPNLSVAENVLLGHEGSGLRLGVFRWRRLFATAQVLLDGIGADIPASAPAESLSLAERELVELARALAVVERARQEAVLLLDEPTSVLAGEEAEPVLREVDRLRERAAVVFVSHRMEEVLRVCDRVCVMADGRIVAERDARSSSVEELQRLVCAGAPDVGGVRREAPSPSAAPPVRLAVEELGRRGSYGGVSFDLHAGEVLGIAGARGSGRESLCRTLFGAEAPDSGTMLLDGHPLELRSPADGVARGIGYVSAERDTEGIIGGMSVSANVTLAHLSAFRGALGIDRRRERTAVEGWIERLRIRTPFPATRAADLSGGNQQKVVLARWLVGPRPTVLILDRPSRGLDVGARAELLALVRELARGGIAIVLVADTLEELLELSDSVLVLRGGRVSARFSVARDRPTPRAILEGMS